MVFLESPFSSHVFQVRGKIRANGLAWSWGLSCSGGRGGRGRWGGGGDDEEEENNAVEKPLSINTQDISMTGYFERSMLRSAMNSIAQVFSEQTHVFFVFCFFNLCSRAAMLALFVSLDFRSSICARRVS